MSIQRVRLVQVQDWQLQVHNSKVAVKTNIEDCMQIEFDSSLITLHLQQKVDTQREQANYTMACPACRNTSLVSC